MTILITGTFGGEWQAAQAVRKLVKSCVPTERVQTLSAGPARRHAAIKVSVMAPHYVEQQLAMKILRDYGADDIKCISVESRAAKSRALRGYMRERPTPTATA